MESLVINNYLEKDSRNLFSQSYFNIITEYTLISQDSF